MKPDRQEMLQEYFKRYGSLSIESEPETLAEFYDGSFLAAGPGGGAAFRNDESFLAWLRELRKFNVNAGMTSMSPAALTETPVGGGYSLVTVTWAATFARTGDAPIRFHISYLLRESAEGLKVAGYISHEDQEEMMRAAGLS